MISKGILQESVEKIRISFQGNFVNALRPRNQSTVLFPNYQNNNWTIKRCNDAKISPVRSLDLWSLLRSRCAKNSFRFWVPIFQGQPQSSRRMCAMLTPSIVLALLCQMPIPLGSREASHPQFISPIFVTCTLVGTAAQNLFRSVCFSVLTLLEFQSI